MDGKKDCIESILFQFDQWVKHREVQDYFEGERCCILADDLYALKQSVENGTVSRNKVKK